MVILVFAATGLVLFILTFSCLFRQSLAFLRTLNKSPNEKTLKNLLFASDVLPERNATAGERNRKRESGSD